MQESKPLESTDRPLLELPELMEKSKVYRELIRFWAEAGLPFDQVIHQVRTDYVNAALRIEKGNAVKAAARIGVHRNTIPRWRRLWEQEP